MDGKAGTEEIQECACDDGVRQAAVFQQIFGFYYPVYGNQFHKCQDAECYVLFDSDTIGNLALDLGDVLVFSGGHADGRAVACVRYVFNDERDSDTLSGRKLGEREACAALCHFALSLFS